MNFDVFLPTKILFGRGRLKELATEPLPGEKALIVTTNGRSMHNLGYLDRLKTLLSRQNIDSEVYDQVLPNPITTQVMEGADLARQKKCDFVIGLGSSSAIDSAKAIAVMATHTGTFWDYVTGERELEAPVLPIVAIPTTASGGTECTSWMAIANPERNQKMGFGDELTFPYLAVIDPELMTAVPKHLTAYQGMDAFFHAVEGYLACVAQPISNLLALDVIRKITTYLPQAVQDGNNLQAREQLAWASMAAGMVENTSGCISEHSMEHALSAYYPDLPHGAGLVALSVPYFSYLLKKDPEKVRVRYIEMGKAMGESGNTPEIFIRGLKKLIKSIDLADLKLSDWGVKPSQAEKLAANSFASMGELYELDPVRLNPHDAKCIMFDAIR